MKRWLPVLLVLTACSGGEEATDDRVRATLGDVDLVLEVADEPAERATGLMGRTEVPPGTGMVFRFDAPSTSRFYMYRVPVPLTAVFISAGRVVGKAEMVPCEDTDPARCPTYGVAASYDVVVETAPATSAGVRVGDAYVQR